MLADHSGLVRRSLLAIALLTAIVLLAAVANAQEKPAQSLPSSATSATAKVGEPRAPNSANTAAGTPAAMPVCTNYKGVSIGMAAEEVRRTLKHLKHESDRQDFFVLAKDEWAQVVYNAEHKAITISVDYAAKDAAPTPEEILGEPVAARADGSIYKRVRYPQAGYWVSYSRTAGNSPVVTVTMQRLRKAK
jgi:hypothetical protein